jgi:hypothetical protein
VIHGPVLSPVAMKAGVLERAGKRLERGPRTALRCSTTTVQSCPFGGTAVVRERRPVPSDALRRHLLRWPHRSWKCSRSGARERRSQRAVSELVPPAAS